MYYPQISDLLDLGEFRYRYSSGFHRDSSVQPGLRNTVKMVIPENTLILQNHGYINIVHVSSHCCNMIAYSLPPSPSSFISLGLLLFSEIFFLQPSILLYKYG